MQTAAQTGNHNTPANPGNYTGDFQAAIQAEVERQLNLSPVYRATCVTVPDAAALLSVSADTLRQWISSGKLPASKIGNNYHIRVSDIEAMLTRYATIVPMKDKRFSVNNRRKC